MANLLDIKRRIRSVKNTQQITKAMKMVAAAKLRRSQDRILATRPYALELAKVTSKLAQAARHPDVDQELEAPDREPELEIFGDEDSLESSRGSSRDGGGEAHPLLQERPEKRVLLAVVTGDRGLAGSFNANVLRHSQQVLGRWDDLELLLLGKKGADFYGRRSVPIRKAYRDLFTEVTYERAREIAADVSEAYSTGEYDAVYVIYNQFKSVMQQELTEERLLPIPVEGEEADAGTEIGVPGGSYIYEPSPEGILTQILPRYIDFQVYRVLLESQAAEHAARMTAMDSATKNAGEMIDKLTLSYNRARQAEITTELIEVVSGANALEG
ncbi:MAG: ATP synthase F1 subunit gamma [Acidobacteriota bacterium]|jgi:F-type H+-transporting ATPase subunit gamma